MQSRAIGELPESCSSPLYFDACYQESDAENQQHENNTPCRLVWFKQFIQRSKDNYERSRFTQSITYHFKRELPCLTRLPQFPGKKLYTTILLSPWLRIFKGSRLHRSGMVYRNRRMPRCKYSGRRSGIRVSSRP